MHLLHTQTHTHKHTHTPKCKQTLFAFATYTQCRIHSRTHKHTLKHTHTTDTHTHHRHRHTPLPFPVAPRWDHTLVSVKVVLSHHVKHTRHTRNRDAAAPQPSRQAHETNPPNPAPLFPTAHRRVCSPTFFSCDCLMSCRCANT